MSGCRIRQFVIVALIAVLCATVACGTPAAKTRTETWVEVQPSIKISNLTHPCLARNSKGDLFITLFIHSTFPSATDSVDAIAVLKSDNNGQSWNEISRIKSHLTYGAWGYDLTIDNLDTLYMTWTATRYQPTSPQPFKTILFSRSDDNGKTWSDAHEVSTETTGQRRNPIIAASGNSVNIAWIEVSNPNDGRGIGGDLVVSSSLDRGATWSKKIAVESELDINATFSSAPSLHAEPNGELYCAYSIATKKEPRGFRIAKSTDHGRSFNDKLHDDKMGIFGDISLTGCDGSLCLAAIVSTAPDLSKPGTKQEVLFYSSSDGGKQWNKAVAIDDDPDNQNKDSVKLVVAGNQRLIAVWNDKRGGIFASVSQDGGQSWGINLQVANKSSVGLTSFDVEVDKVTGNFFLAASDIRNGASDSTSLVPGKIDTK